MVCLTTKTPTTERNPIMFDIFNMLKKNEENKTMQVTRETIIGDILDMDQTTAPYFMEIGMQALPQAAQTASNIWRSPLLLRAPPFLRASRQGLQRWGWFSKPRDA